MKLIAYVIISFIIMQTLHAQEAVKIKITFGTASFVATTYNNATAKAFIALLPITVTMNELNGNEKYYYLSGNLPDSPSNPSTIQNGDLMLYGSNCIVLFYETFSTSYSYTKIGSIDNPIGLKTALGSNNPTVTFEVAETTTGINETRLINQRVHISDGVLKYSGNAYKISLIDLNGKIVASTTLNVLNVHAFLHGIYILKVEGKNQTETIKIKI